MTNVRTGVDTDTGREEDRPRQDTRSRRVNGIRSNLTPKTVDVGLRRTGYINVCHFVSPNRLSSGPVLRTKTVVD